MITNCHTHIFTPGAVPADFLPFGLVRLLAERKISLGIARSLNRLSREDEDFFDRYARFLKIGALGDEAAIFAEMQRFYPIGTRFVVLSLDMEYMGCGQPKQSFEDQLEKLATLKRQSALKDFILPFFCVDPRRPGLLQMVQKYIDPDKKKRIFGGIKIYPPLGFFPYDQRLDGVWKYAEKNEIPVIAHASRGGIYYKGDLDPVMFSGDLLGQAPTDGDNRTWCNYFAHPLHYRELLRKFPKLRVCLAHFGGGDDWADRLKDPVHSTGLGIDDNWLYLIKTLLGKYATLYTDIAYTLSDQSYFSYLKVLLQEPSVREKVLFGSDYFLVEQDGTEKEFSIDLRGYLGESDFTQIATTNPARFLA